MGNLSEHFDIQEFVGPSVYKSYKENSKWFIDPLIISVAEFVRIYFYAPVTINNWYLPGGNFKERGFREPDTKTGARLSQHKFGRAIDLNVKGLSSMHVAKRIIDDYPMFRDAGLTTMEDPDDTPTWTHLDVRQTGLDHLLIVNG